MQHFPVFSYFSFISKQGYTLERKYRSHSAQNERDFLAQQLILLYILFEYDIVFCDILKSTPGYL
jgi:hypothetical protein